MYVTTDVGTQEDWVSLCLFTPLLQQLWAVTSIMHAHVIIRHKLQLSQPLLTALSS